MWYKYFEVIAEDFSSVKKKYEEDEQKVYTKFITEE